MRVFLHWVLEAASFYNAEIDWVLRCIFFRFSIEGRCVQISPNSTTTAGDVERNCFWLISTWVVGGIVSNSYFGKRSAVRVMTVLRLHFLVNDKFTGFGLPDY